MAVPILAMASAMGRGTGLMAGGLRTTAIVGGASLVSSIAGTFLSPITREFHYRANATGPDIVPPQDAAIAAYHAGRIPHESLTQILRWCGISWTPQLGTRSVIKDAWWNIVDLSKPVWSIEDFRRWYRRDTVTEETLRASLRRHGFTDRVQQDLFIEDYIALPEAIVFELLVRGDISLAEARERLLSLGYLRGYDVDLLLGMHRPPDVGDILVMRNRDMIDDAGMEKYLRWAGFPGSEERSRIAELRNQIPGPSDLIRFSVREAWAEDIVTQFGYDEEFPPLFQYWMDRQGVGWGGGQVTIDGTNYPDVKWPQAYWRAHWQLPSPTQGYEFVRRCRGDVNNPATWRIPGVKPFTRDDLVKLLRTADYPKFFRPLLEAISYRVPTRVDVRRMLAHHTINASDATEYYQDMGYIRRDAELLTRFAQSQNDTTIVRKLQAGIRSQTLHGYRTGSVSRKDAASALYLLALPSWELIEEFRAKPIVEQHELALNNTNVTASLDSIDIDIRARMIDKAINAIRKTFIRLELPEEQVRTALSNLGIFQTRIDEYISLWRYQMLEKGKSVSASQISRWVTRGVITVEDALFRLRLLGYSVIDAQSMIGLALQDQGLLAAKMQAKLATSAKQAQNAAKAQLRELRRLQREAQADLARHGTPAKLSAWLTQGLIGVPEFRLRLSNLGWPLPDIDRLQAEAIAKRKGSKNGQTTSTKTTQETQVPASTGPGAGR